jgi:hypothetical protein
VKHKEKKVPCAIGKFVERVEKRRVCPVEFRNLAAGGDETIDQLWVRCCGAR